MEELNKSLSAENIDDISKEERFFKSEKDEIRRILKKTQRIKLETGKRIIEGLIKEQGDECLSLLSDIDIDFGIDFSTGIRNEIGALENKDTVIRDIRSVFSPLIETKILGIPIFKVILEFVGKISTRTNDQTEETSEEEETRIIEESGEGDEIRKIVEPGEGVEKETDEEVEVEIDVDWEFEYEEAKKDIKKLQKIPLEERVKIIRKKMEKVKNMKEASEEEAANKYCDNKKDRKECLKILENIREGRMKIEERNEYYQKVGKEMWNDPLLKAVQKAIEANDCPCVMALSKGCFLPSAASIRNENYIFSLFGYSCKVFSDECALFLLEAGGGIEQKFELGRTPLSEALAANNEAIGMYLIEEGVDIGYIDSNKFTTLHIASLNNYYEIAKILIDRGANIDAKDKEEYTPLHLAAQENNLKVAMLLIDRGACIDAKDKDGNNPLHCAAYWNSFEVAKLLMDKGIDVQVKGNEGKTPLHYAAQNNSFETTQLLIKRGAIIEAKAEQEWTPLHNASAQNHSFETIKLLIDEGANIEAKDNYRCTPLHYAASENRVEVAKFLIDRGANIEAKNYIGKNTAPLCCPKK